MINFSLQSFLWSLILLRQEVALAALRAASDPKAKLEGDDLERFRDNFEGMAKPLRKLFIADGRLSRIAGLVRSGSPPPLCVDVAHELAALDSDIMDATATERFYHYPRDKGFQLIRVASDWAVALQAFPKLQGDIASAVDCYALGQPRASIYHSMMILEAGLIALCKKLKVHYVEDRSTWGSLIRDIKNVIEDGLKAIKEKPSKTRTAADARRKAFLLDCEEAAIEFGYFKDAWRDHIAHRRRDYNDKDAHKVLEHVRNFMEILSTKLKLKDRS